MLIENNLFEKNINKIEIAIKILKEFEPTEGYYLAFSGGKDSIVIYKLAEMANVRFDAHYSITGIDPPELVRFVMKNYPKVKREYIKKTMWQLIPEKLMPPTRLVRYCCEHLKERGGSGRLVITGIRSQESHKRSKRKLVEFCFKDKTKRYLNIIIDWTEKEIWQFIKKYNLNYCSLYDDGYKRIGCIACPMSGEKTMIKELEKYPKFKKLYLKAFSKMIEKRKERGLTCTWETADEVMNWWLKQNNKLDDPDQGILFE
jgi:phosphoadenosine phosphosulfate reductase